LKITTQRIITARVSGELFMPHAERLRRALAARVGIPRAWAWFAPGILRPSRGYRKHVRRLKSEARR